MTDDTLIHESELADILGLTSNRVRILTRDGILSRAAPARYDLRATVRAYVEHLRAGARGRAPGDAELKSEKARQTREAADKLAIQNAASRRELLPARDVETAWASTLRNVRAGMLALPSRVAQRLGHLTAHDLSEIDHEVRAVLSEAAGGSDAR